MMDSGNGRMREVMKGVIEHYSEDGRRTKADGIHMFSNFLRKTWLVCVITNQNIFWISGNVPFVDPALEV